MTEEKIHVLIIEDDAVDQMAYERFFKKEDIPYNYIFADSVKSAKGKLTENSFDIIISDYMLGDGTALDLFPDFKHTPIILVTGTGDEETAVKAMKLGASDYLIKDPEGFFLNTLPVTVKNALARRKAEEELKKYRESLEELVKERTIELENEIKERKRVEEVIRTSEARQSLILGSLPMAFYIAQPFGDYGGTWVSEQIFRIAGYVPERFNEDIHLWAKRLHPEDRDQTLAVFDSLQKKNVIRVEYRWQRADGKYIWIEDNAVLVRDESGKPKEIIGTWLDITERKEILDALRKSEAKYRLIAENVSDVIFTADLNYNYTYISPSVKTQRGYSPDDFMKHRIGDTLTPASAKIIRETIKEELEIENKKSNGKSGPRKMELEAYTKDGAIIWVEVVLSFTYDQNNNPTGILGVTRDITERKKAEEEKEALKKQLLQTQKMEALGTLAGGIAHDFNNILSIIFGYVDLAIMDINIPDRLQVHLDEVGKAARRAKDLITQILTLSRRKEQEKKPLRLSIIVKETLKLLQSTIPASIEIRHSIDSQETVIADSTQVHQIIMNLCTNAYHAMRNTSGILAVSLKDMEISDEDFLTDLGILPGKYIRLEISDTGGGMDDETKEKIFDPYFTTKEIGEGTGLGLSVVHGIVSSHSGYIKVYSELSIGTTFHVYLPAVGGSAFPSGTVEKKEPVKGGKERIMVVDDEQKIINITNEVLIKYGYDVKTYNNSTLALQEFEKDPEKYDLIITDMTMPHMNGLEFAKKLIEITSDIPIILCSGYSELISKEIAEKMGLHYFPKPIVMSDLVRTTRKILDKVQV
jgi:PAS domain S-box-containing protein